MQLSSKYSSFILSLTLLITVFSIPASAQSQGQIDDGMEGGGPMSNRIRKHMDQEGDDSGPGQNQGMNRRQKMRQKLLNMPPEQREMFMQRMQERRQNNMIEGDFEGQRPFRPQFEDGQGPEQGMGRGGMRRQKMQRPGGMGPGMRQGGMRPGGMRQGFGGLSGGPLDLSQLNLTEKQKNAILTLRSKHSEQAKSLQKSLRGKRMELRNLLFSQDLNKKTLLEKRNELRGLQNQLDDIMMDDFLGIRSQLSEEQIKKLAETNSPQKRRAAEGLPRMPEPAALPSSNSGPGPE